MKFFQKLGSADIHYLVRDGQKPKKNWHSLTTAAGFKCRYTSVSQQFCQLFILCPQ